MVSAGHVWSDRRVSTREGSYPDGDGYVTVQSMGVAKASVVITRNVEDVFGVLSDVTNVPKWNRNAIEVTPLTSGPMRVGSRRRAVSRTFGGGTQTNEAEMVEFEPRRRMVVKSVGGPFVWRAVIEFGEISGGTSIDRTWTFERPRGLYGVMSPVLPTLMRKEFQRDLDNLKRLMESGGL